MTDGFDKNDVAANSGAYALNALNEPELSEFEAQLAESEQLRNEVTELTDTAVLLGMAVTPVQPPAALRDSIMAKIATTPQLSREVAPVRTLPTARAIPGNSAEQDAPPSALQTKTSIRWFQRPMMVAAAAVAAVIIVSGGVVGINAAQNGIAHEQQADALTSLYSAPDAQRTTSSISSGGKATLVYSLSLKKSALIMSGLAKLPSNKTYELWYIDSKGHPTGAGLVQSEGKSTTKVLDGKLTAGDTIGVTVEPAGGSPRPTTTPIVAITSA
jgi:anti-sigma-K factor RskA